MCWVLLRWLSLWQVFPSLQRTPETQLEWLSGSWSPPWARPFLSAYSDMLRKSLLQIFPVSQSLRPLCFWEHLQFCTFFLICSQNIIVEVNREFFGLHSLAFDLASCEQLDLTHTGLWVFILSSLFKLTQVDTSPENLSKQDADVGGDLNLFDSINYTRSFFNHRKSGLTSSLFSHSVTFANIIFYWIH